MKLPSFFILSARSVVVYGEVEMGWADSKTEQSGRVHQLISLLNGLPQKG